MNNIFISSELSKIIKETINDKLIKGNIEVVLCPDCESYIGKTSYYNNKLRYYCKSCGKTFYNLKKNILEKNINYDTKGRFVKKAIPWNKGILNGFFSKRRFIDIMKKNGLNKYAELFNKSILWDKIKKIEEYNYQGDVYDFTVPNVENFAAGVGGIITHNTASFAGQQETYLNIKGADSVVDAVKRCWASLYTPRAIYYRIKNNFPHDKVLIAVVIQKMIHSEVSGVMFTINPATNSDEIVIEAGFGLGDAIVGGEISPDTYIISKNPFNIKSRKISKQEWMYDREAVGGRVKRELTKEKGSRQKISDESILKLAEFAVEIEEHYGKPMDIEWAVENNKTYIVQARPVTTMKKVGAVEAVESGGELLLTGLGASPGVSVGNVKIVSSQAEISKVEHGDVLVAIMTSPDYVPSMERASAIVTDEGGITCFAGDTKVLTNKGFLSMREIHERQVTEEEFLILGYDYAKKKSAWKRVVQIDFRIRSECIRVSVSQKGNLDHNTLDLTSDHKMYTYRNRLLIKKKISEILYDQEALCLLESLPKGGIFLKQDKLAYLMGAILSDGCVQIRNHSTGNPRSGIVTFTQKDTPEKREFVEEVRACFTEFFGEEFSAPRLKVTDSWLSGRHICGSAMDHICSKLYPAQVLTKITQDLSAWAVGLTEASALCFLAGLIDGDGCFYENRLHIYILKENVLQATVLACMRLRILPQVSINRNIHHVQIVERIEDILEHTKRVKGSVWTRDMGTRFFAAKQILGDVVDQVNWKGRLKPYVEKNLLLDYEKIMIRISPMASPELREELGVILNSGLRMQRLKQVQSLGSMEVFNIEVEALDEMEHNYIVFTKKYTPILVSNSHAAIVSRELGIPCVVGTEKATKILHDGQKITVDGFTGKVYLGEKVVEKAKEVVKTKEVDIDVGDLITGTKIYINLSEPEKVEEYKHLPFDGIGLMRTEFIITDYIKEHPLHLIKIGAEQKYIDKLAEGISIVAGAINNKPMTVRFSDFKTNEYKNLEGGSEYEPHEENPMLGWRGVSRYISEEFKEAFRLECKAIVKVRETYKNVHVMLPFVRTLDEVKKVLNILDSEGLRDGSDFHIYLMAEVPSFALLAEDFAELSITGCSIGSNDLTQLILGVDRDSARLGKMGYFDERNEAVKKAIRMIIRGFHKHGKTVSICGQAPSEYEEIVEFLIKEGIDVISLNPDVVVKTRLLVASVERKILLGKIRS